MGNLTLLSAVRSAINFMLPRANRPFGRVAYFTYLYLVYYAVVSHILPGRACCNGNPIGEALFIGVAVSLFFIERIDNYQLRNRAPAQAIPPRSAKWLLLGRFVCLHCMVLLYPPLRIGPWHLFQMLLTYTASVHFGVRGALRTGGLLCALDACLFLISPNMSFQGYGRESYFINLQLMSLLLGFTVVVVYVIVAANLSSQQAQRYEHQLRKVNRLLKRDKRELRQHLRVRKSVSSRVRRRLQRTYPRIIANLIFDEHSANWGADEIQLRRVREWASRVLLMLRKSHKRLAEAGEFIERADTFQPLSNLTRPAKVEKPYWLPQRPFDALLTVLYGLLLGGLGIEVVQGRLSGARAVMVGAVVIACIVGLLVFDRADARHYYDHPPKSVTIYFLIGRLLLCGIVGVVWARDYGIMLAWIVPYSAFCYFGSGDYGDWSGFWPGLLVWATALWSFTFPIWALNGSFSKLRQTIEEYRILHIGQTESGAIGLVNLSGFMLSRYSTFVIFLIMWLFVLRVAKLTMDERRSRLTAEASSERLLPANDRLRVVFDKALVAAHQRVELSGYVHDTLNRYTVLLVRLLDFAILKGKTNRHEALVIIHAARELAESALRVSMTPKEIHDLGGEIRALCNAQHLFVNGKRLAIQLRLEFSRDGLDSKTRTALYYIASEALINICKHSEADKALVTLKARGQSFYLIVEDYGRTKEESSRRTESSTYPPVNQQIGCAPFDGFSSGVGLTVLSEHLQALGGCLRRANTPSGSIVTAVAPRNGPYRIVP